MDVHFTAVESITEGGIVGADGRKVSNLDTIVCATGFDTSYRPKFTLIGKHGIAWQEQFTPVPHSYSGVSAPSKLIVSVDGII